MKIKKKDAEKQIYRSVLLKKNDIKENSSVVENTSGHDGSETNLQSSTVNSNDVDLQSVLQRYV